MAKEKIWGAVSTNWLPITTSLSPISSIQTLTIESNSETLDANARRQEFTVIRCIGEVQVMWSLNAGRATGAYGLIALDQNLPGSPTAIIDPIGAGDADWLYWNGYGVTTIDGEAGTDRTIHRNTFDVKGRRTVERREAFCFVFAATTTTPALPQISFRYSIRYLMLV